MTPLPWPVIPLFITRPAQIKLGPSTTGFVPPTNLTGQGLDTDPAAQEKNLGPRPAWNAIFSYFTL